VKNTLGFTDPLNATPTITDATHFITVGDSEPITATAPQPLVTTVQGILQALAVFKGSLTAQITGDIGTGTLTLNIISSTVGTYAPRSVAPIDTGLMFAANDGIRTLSQSGSLGDPNEDLRNPFIFALVPSRMSAAYNNNIYRISVQNGHANGNPVQEYWYDFRNKGWTGPHTFVQSMASPYLGTFICFSNTIAPALFTSDVVQSGASTFVENGVPMSFVEQTAPLADDGGPYECSAILSVIDMHLPHIAQSYTFVASDVDNGVLSTATIASSPTGAIWDGFTWGVGIWTALSYGLERYNIPWQQPLVFSRLVWQITGYSNLGFKVGKLTIPYQPLKYVRLP
jgi:hypothetical protein